MLATVAIAVIAAFAPLAAADTPRSPLVRRVGEAAVDWGAGLVSARSGAAADLRMPGPDAARADALRAARARAQATLRPALARLPLAGQRRISRKDVEAALERARIISADYQSNGGVVLALGVRFDDLTDEAKSEPGSGEGQLVLSIPSMPFETAPVIVGGGKEFPLRHAVYRLGTPPRQERPVPAKRDRQGRLVVPARAIEALGGPPTRAVIYLRRAPRR